MGWVYKINYNHWNNYYFNFSIDGLFSNLNNKFNIIK